MTPHSHRRWLSILLISVTIAISAGGYLAWRHWTRPQPAAIGAAARLKPFIASSRRFKFHVPTCRFARMIPDASLLGFDSADQARGCGLTACQVCRPQ